MEKPCYLQQCVASVFLAFYGERKCDRCVAWIKINSCTLFVCKTLWHCCFLVFFSKIVTRSALRSTLLLAEGFEQRANNKRVILPVGNSQAMGVGEYLCKRVKTKFTWVFTTSAAKFRQRQWCARVPSPLLLYDGRKYKVIGSWTSQEWMGLFL